MNRIGNILVKADNVCDYIPIVSTATNLVNLFQKTVVLPYFSAETVTNSHFYTHLKEKDTTRCLTLLVPILGNILVLLDDFVNNKERILANLQNGCGFGSFFRRKNDAEFVLEAYRVVPQYRALFLELCSEELKKDPSFIMGLIKISPKEAPSVLAFTDAKLRDDQEFMLNAIEQNATLIHEAGKKLRNNKAFIIAAMKRNPSVAEALIIGYQGEKAEWDKRQDHWKALIEDIKGSDDFSESVKSQFNDLIVGQPLNV